MTRLVVWSGVSLVFACVLVSGCAGSEGDSLDRMWQYGYCSVVSGQGVPDAPGYTQAAPTKILVVEPTAAVSYGCSPDGTFSYTPTDPSEVELIAVWTRTFQTTNKMCDYTGMSPKALVHSIWRVDLRETRTGQLVSQSTFEGNYRCPSSIVAGGTPNDNKDLHNIMNVWLAQFGS